MFFACLTLFFFQKGVSKKVCAAASLDNNSGFRMRVDRGDDRTSAEEG